MYLLLPVAVSFLIASIHAQPCVTWNCIGARFSQSDNTTSVLTMVSQIIGLNQTDPWRRTLPTIMIDQTDMLADSPVEFVKSHVHIKSKIDWFMGRDNVAMDIVVRSPRSGAICVTAAVSLDLKSTNASNIHAHRDQDNSKEIKHDLFLAAMTRITGKTLRPGLKFLSEENQVSLLSTSCVPVEDSIKPLSTYTSPLETELAVNDQPLNQTVIVGKARVNEQCKTNAFCKMAAKLHNPSEGLQLEFETGKPCEICSGLKPLRNPIVANLQSFVLEGDHVLKDVRLEFHLIHYSNESYSLSPRIAGTLEFYIAPKSQAFRLRLNYKRSAFRPAAITEQDLTMHIESVGDRWTFATFPFIHLFALKYKAASVTDFHLQMAQKEPIELHGYMWLGAASQRPKFQPAGNDSVHAPEYFRGKANVRLDLNDPMRTTTDLTFEFRVNFYFLLKHVFPKCRFDIPKFVRDFIFTDARLKVYTNRKNVAVLEFTGTTQMFDAPILVFFRRVGDSREALIQIRPMEREGGLIVKREHLVWYDSNGKGDEAVIDIALQLDNATKRISSAATMTRAQSYFMKATGHVEKFRLTSTGFAFESTAVVYGLHNATIAFDCNAVTQIIMLDGALVPKPETRLQLENGIRRMSALILNTQTVNHGDFTFEFDERLPHLRPWFRRRKLAAREVVVRGGFRYYVRKLVFKQPLLECHRKLFFLNTTVEAVIFGRSRIVETEILFNLDKLHEASLSIASILDIRDMLSRIVHGKPFVLPEAESGDDRDSYILDDIVQNIFGTEGGKHMDIDSSESTDSEFQQMLKPFNM